MENERHRCLLLCFRRSWEKGMSLGSSLKMQWSKRKVSWGTPSPKSHGWRLLWEKNMGLIGAHRQVPHLCGWISLSNSTFLQYRWIMIFPKEWKFLKELDIWAYRSMFFCYYAVFSDKQESCTFFFCAGKAVCALSSIKLWNLKVVLDLQEL